MALAIGQQSPAKSSGQELLDALHARMREVKAVQFDLALKPKGEKLPAGANPPSMTYILGRDGLSRVRIGGTSGADRESITTPNGMLMLNSKAKQYSTQKFDKPQPSSRMIIPGFEGLVAGTPVPKALGEAKKTTFYGQEALAVAFAASEHSGGGQQTLYVAPGGTHPLGVSIARGDQTMEAVFQNLKINPDIAADTFALTPPAGWTKQESQSGDLEASLLKVGTAAPAFTAKTATGQGTSLQALTKGKKGTLVNFWFYG
jgi:outer membrane lipoprotein-sorting protein